MSNEVIQVVLIPALRPAFEAWLAQRGLVLARMPTDPDDLPTYVTALDPETCRCCPAVGR